MKIASQADLKRIDETFLKTTGMTETELIAGAGKTVADFIRGELRIPGTVGIAVICGGGNNGADGFATAMALIGSGFSGVRIYAAKPRAALRPSTAWFYERLERAVTDISEKEKFEKAKDGISGAEVVVDCLLGTGVNAAVTGLFAEIVAFVNSLGKKVVSVDLPSGFYSDSADLPAVHIDPGVTVAIGLPKISLVMGPAKYHRGKLYVRNIGFGDELLKDPVMKTNLYDEKLAKEDLPARPDDSFKGYFGHCAIWAGSEGKAGAAGLASIASLRTGAGLTTVLGERNVLSIIAGFHPEVMTAPVSFESPADEAEEAMIRILKDKTVVLAGPGLGTSDKTKEYFRRLMKNYRGPLVLDADAINMLAPEQALLKEFMGRLVLTPHPGEISRLLGREVDKIDDSVIEAARAYAKEKNAWIVLKSSDTLVFDPSDGQVWLNSTGNAGLAKAGSGDVLAGIITGILSQKFGLEKRLGTKFDFTRALCFAVWLHGRAADLAAEKTDMRSMIAGDVIGAISDAYRSIT